MNQKQYAGRSAIGSRHGANRRRGSKEKDHGNEGNTSRTLGEVNGGVRIPPRMQANAGVKATPDEIESGVTSPKILPRAHNSGDVKGPANYSTKAALPSESLSIGGVQSPSFQKGFAPPLLKTNQSDDAVTKRRTFTNYEFPSFFKDSSSPNLASNNAGGRTLAVLDEQRGNYVGASRNNDPQNFRLLQRPSDATPEMRQHTRSLRDVRDGVASNSKDDLAVLNFSPLPGSPSSGNKLNKFRNVSDETIKPAQPTNSKRGLEELIYNYSPEGGRATLSGDDKGSGEGERLNQERALANSYGTSPTLGSVPIVQPAGKSESAASPDDSVKSEETSFNKAGVSSPIKNKVEGSKKTHVTFEFVKPRTREIMKFLNHFWIINLVLILGITYLLTFVGPFKYSDSDIVTLRTCWAFAWLIPFPLTIMNFVGMITPFRTDKERYDRVNKKPRRFDNLYVVVVARGDNRNAILRSWEFHRHLEQIPKVRIHILTDEPYYFENTNCFSCPKSFKCKAMYKARALEWYRRMQKLTKYDWVLHLDEESIVDTYTINRCIEFIKYSPHLMGQGVILYNQYRFWKNWVFTAADAIRVGDDIGRFHMQYELFHYFFIGAHGSFLLNNGRVENDVTWELTSFTEDYQFAIISSQKNYTCGQIDGVIREQSPQRLMDFLRQRRRWFCGISRVKLVKSKFYALCWFLGVFSVPIFVVSVVMGILGTSLIPRWIGYMINFNLAVLVVLMGMGSAIQSYDAHMNFFKGTIQLIATLALMPVSSIIESMALIYSIVKPPKSFDVIRK